MNGAAALFEAIEDFIDDKVDFEHLRAVLAQELQLAPELSGAVLQRLDALRRANRMSSALHLRMCDEVERSSGGEITPPFGESSEDPVPAKKPPVLSLRASEDEPPDALAPAPAPALRQSPEVGAVLAGRYRLTALLGRGGMNLVYRAEDLRGGGDRSGVAAVAVKLLAPEYTGREARRVLEWEASLLSGMSHPGLVRMLDFDNDGEHSFLVMELLEGERLRARLVRNGQAPLPLDEAMRIVRELAAAVSHVHQQGYVHRDLKPANVFVTAAGGVKVFDFGLAAPIGGSNNATAPVLKPGTPRYASLEMLEGGLPDPRDDVYSLGCIAYEMLAGRHPWGGLPVDEAAHRKLRLMRPRGLSDVRWNVLRQSLAFEAANRPADAAVFLASFFPSGRQRRVLPWAAAAVLVGIAVAVALLIVQPAQPPVQSPGQPSGRQPDQPPGEPVGTRPAAVLPPVETPRTESAADAPVTVELPAEDSEDQRPAGPATDGEQVAEEIATARDEVLDEPAPSAADPRPAPRATPAPATLAFAADRFRISEGSGALRLEMRRPAGYSAPLRVLWRTVDQTARDGVDFMGSPAWRWAEAPSTESSLVIFVPIIDDSVANPDRTFLVELAQVLSGPIVGQPDRAEVTIVDND